MKEPSLINRRLLLLMEKIMKNLIKLVLAFALLAATNINAFEASSANTQVSAVPHVLQNVVLDGNQQSFSAPHDGIYAISFNANAFNERNNPGLITIKAYVNNTPSNTVTATVQVPGRQQMPIHFAGTLELKQNDVVTFRWGTTGAGSSVVLQPVNNTPSFAVSINPERPSVKL